MASSFRWPVIASKASGQGLDDPIASIDLIKGVIALDDFIAMTINSLQCISSLTTLIDIAIVQSFARIVRLVFASFDACRFVELKLNDKRHEVAQIFNVSAGMIFCRNVKITISSNDRRLNACIFVT